MRISGRAPSGTVQIGAVYPQVELRGDPGAVRRFGRARRRPARPRAREKYDVWPVQAGLSTLGARHRRHATSMLSAR